MAKMTNDLKSNHVIPKLYDCGIERSIGEYNGDFNRIAHQRERKRKIFKHQSHQFPYRKYLVDYLKKTCAERGHSRACLFLAVYFLDLYMDFHKVNVRRLMLVAIASIIMAAKVEENSTNVPKLIDLMAVRDEDSLRYFSNLEKTMLEYFNFELIIPTPAHHIPYFMRAIVTDDEQRICKIPNIIDCMVAVMEMYQDVLLYDVHLLQSTSPSKLAAALVAACRLRFGFAPWNHKLRSLSNYAEHDFQDVLSKILDGNRITSCINCYTRFSYR